MVTTVSRSETVDGCTPAHRASVRMDIPLRSRACLTTSPGDGEAMLFSPNIATRIALSAFQ
jgi:hypothetical protein